MEDYKCMMEQLNGVVMMGMSESLEGRMSDLETRMQTRWVVFDLADDFGAREGEGCGERRKEKEREQRAPLSFAGWPVSFESFDVRHGVLVERGFSLLSLCHPVAFTVLRDFSMH